MRPINEIIIHCTATRAEWRKGRSAATKVAEVRRWHVEDRGWSDVGYHFLIDRDGTVVEGRPLKRVGAHVKGHNRGTIGIALFGGHGGTENDQFDEHFTRAQDAALRELIGRMKDIFGDFIKVSGHNEYAAKACPCFNVSQWLRGDPGVELDVEAEIQKRGLTAPRVTPAMLESEIIQEQFHVFEGSQLTVCCLTMRNGFTVTGESACASPENFDADIGKQIARKNAREKIWSLLGFRLRDQLAAG